MNIWWIQRNIRLTDNKTLTAALQEGNGLLPVFILDRKILENQHTLSCKDRFLFSALKDFDKALQLLGSKLIVRVGNPVDEIIKLAGEVDAKKVYTDADVHPALIRQYNQLGEKIELNFGEQPCIFPFSAVTKKNGKPYQVFTPFSRAWKALPINLQLFQSPDYLPSVPDIFSVTLPVLSHLDTFPAEEFQAARKLKSFMDGPIYTYSDSRNMLCKDGTSFLSPYFRWGLLSKRQALHAAFNAKLNTDDFISMSNCDSWINEIIWNDFFQAIMHFFPEVLDGPFRNSMQNLEWSDSEQNLQLWKDGLTGYPVVDAGMRQLRNTGWMHNRARMITSSFLVKHLLINWQEGERWFYDLLIDGDPALNNGNWQWAAGTGTDSVPYFRIFNPILQGKKYDPHGMYIRRWIPELSDVPDRFIHTPWLMTSVEQKSCHVQIGNHYPLPIVDHNAARLRALSVLSRK